MLFLPCIYHVLHYSFITVPVCTLVFLFCKLSIVIFSYPWIGLSSVLRPRQHSIGYIGDGFYRLKDPTNSIKVLKEKATKENTGNANKKYTYTGWAKLSDTTLHVCL